MNLTINIKTGSNMVLYTYKDAVGQRCALVVQNNLAPLPNAYAVKEAMLNPRTPNLVRTMLFNELANRIRPAAERGIVAENVYLKQTADGFTFLEVELSPAGLEYVKTLHVHRMGYYPMPDYTLFDPNAADAARLYSKFTKPLKRALAMLGLYQ